MSESDETSRILANLNETFDVELESYSGSGAKWQLVPQDDGPRLVKETRRPHDQTIGGAATHVFTFQAETPGTHKLVFELKRPWEPSARNRKEFSVEVL